jgi:hypothetical protein
VTPAIALVVPLASVHVPEILPAPALGILVPEPRPHLVGDAVHEVALVAPVSPVARTFALPDAVARLGIGSLAPVAAPTSVIAAGIGFAARAASLPASLELATALVIVLVTRSTVFHRSHPPRVA